MALVSTIFGSIFGCLCFLVALMLFKVSFAAAFGLYMGVALLTVAVMMTMHFAANIRPDYSQFADHIR